MENTELHTHKLENEENFGEVRIADEVVAIIAGLAASEVEGVASMAGNVTRDLIGKLGMKSLSKVSRSPWMKIRFMLHWQSIFSTVTMFRPPVPRFRTR